MYLDDRSSGHVAIPVVLQSRSFLLGAHKVYETQSASRGMRCPSIDGGVRHSVRFFDRNTL